MTIYMDDAPHVVGAASTLMALALISYALRVVVRHSSKMWGLEDTVMTIGIVSITCRAVVADVPKRMDGKIQPHQQETDNLDLLVSLHRAVCIMYPGRPQRHRCDRCAHGREDRRRLRDGRHDVLLPL